jgi:hypothetical protein
MQVRVSDKSIHHKEMIDGAIQLVVTALEIYRPSRKSLIFSLSQFHMINTVSDNEETVMTILDDLFSQCGTVSIIHIV